MRLLKAPIVYRTLFALFFIGCGAVLMKARDNNFSPRDCMRAVYETLGLPVPPPGPPPILDSTPASPLRPDFPGVLSPKYPEWKIRHGLDVELVASGFSYPVNIAFANNTGEDPTSPWFYVSELHGAIKYVAHDGSTHLFADNITKIDPEVMYFSDESGIIGLTTVPDSEDLIVTYSSINPQVGLLSSKVVRLISEPGGKKMERAEIVLDLDEPTAPSHQIQATHVAADGTLYVAVGDGEDPRRSLDKEKFGGKILRMNLDGSPCKDNPFYQLNVPTTPSHYVFAYGFRNPFDFAFHPDTGQVFVSDNGPDTDRILRADPGGEYGYTGLDSSMKTNALYTWGPPNNPGPAGITILNEPVLGKDSHGVGYLAMASNPRRLLGQSIWEIKIDPLTGGLRGEPQPVVNYVGDTKATVVGLAEGPDGLYFTDFFGDSRGLGQDAGHGRIWKLKASEETLQLLPTTDLAKAPPRERGRVYFEKNCRVCHSLQNRGGGVGPNLDGIEEVLTERLNRNIYKRMVGKLLKSDATYFVSQRPRLKSILAAKEEQRVKLWLGYHIADPRFDNPYSKMPQFEKTLPAQQRQDIIEFLLNPND